ncbi:GNAT family N-acetyltransferase [Saccharothrix coeruleofusca]|uniref:N-acetyltransferase domain-containing protein n=1 Tax=Saccharothrix coeruleofusca TaxID=33919 RepID=A0A918ASG6_9PSEU|nr:GNAT family N-acetyltransferase [Saccharothrix coeruleofusca]GGP77775.1 hypothetical protein GCM10010185_59530 [Saccharothrix coeruleofusca]
MTGIAETAAHAAEAASRAAGVRVRDLTDLPDLDAVYRLYDDIWRPDPTNPPVTTELLRALTKGGNHVAGAYDGTTLVGASVAFFGPPADRVMHSHVTGVAPTSLGRDVGFALKLHQRAWALRRGVTAITWTFDPLVSRNAYFNLAKLGGAVAEYLPDFYGGMRDAINGDDATDRLLVRWDLAAPEVEAACAGSPARPDAERAGAAVVALGRDERGAPVPGSTDGGTVLVAVPPDVTALRRTDPGLARRWRVAVREVLSPLVAEGPRATGFDRAGWYVISRGERWS